MSAQRILIAVFLFVLCSGDSLAENSHWLHADGKRKIFCPFAWHGSTSFLWTGKLDGNQLATGSGMLRVTTQLSNRRMQFSLVGEFKAGRAINDVVILTSDGSALIATTKNGILQTVQSVERNSQANVQAYSSGYQPSQNKATEFLSTLESSAKDIKKVSDTVKKGVEIYRQFKPAAPSQPTTRLYVKSVTAKSTKSNGAGWDNGNGEPDLKVIIKSGFLNSSLKTGVSRDNALRAKYSNASIAVKSGDKLTISVMDQDFLNDDLVGMKTLTVTSSMIDKGKLVFAFGQVEELHLEFTQ